MKNTSQILVAICLLAISVISSANGEMIEILTKQGANQTGYIAGPVHSKASVLVVHDWFGLTDFTKSTVERFAKLGYRTLAIDLYDGKSAINHDGATKLMNALVETNTQADVSSALDYLKMTSDSVAIIGFSLGGGISLKAALANPKKIDAVAMIYAGSFEETDTAMLTNLNAPVLSVAGGADNWSRESTLKFIPIMQEAEKSYEVYIYPDAEHAYAQPLYNEGKNINKEATRMTWLVLDDFLARNL